MSPDDPLVLCLARVLPAPRAAVYRALTDATELREWWGPNGFTTPCAAFDPEVGSGYRIAMQPPDGDLFHLLGEFREVESPSRLAYTVRWDPPHQDDRETVVTLSLDDRAEETRVRLSQGEFATEERYALHEAGWIESLERLERLLASVRG